MTVKELIEQLKQKNIPLDTHLEMETYDFHDDDNDTLTLYPDGTISYDEYSKTVILTVY